MSPPARRTYRYPAGQEPLPIPAHLAPPAKAERKPCKRCDNKNCTCLEDALARQLDIPTIPPPVRQLEFAAGIGRRWKADFGWGYIKLIVEIEGGIWSGGAHVTGTGYAEDCEKYNTAQLLGWMVLRFTDRMVHDGTALRVIERALHLRGVRMRGGRVGYTRDYRAG